MEEKEYITIAEFAKFLGISRIAVYKKVKAGKIKAVKFGRAFLIPSSCLEAVQGKVLTEESKKEIEKAVHKTVEEYGETLKMLGKE